MSESSPSGFSLRDLLERIRRRLPWPKPPIRPPGQVDPDGERTRAQVSVIRHAFRESGDVGAGSRDGLIQPRDDAEANFLFRPGYALVRDNTDDRRYFEEFTDFFGRRSNDFEGEPRRLREPSPGMVLVELPSRRDEADTVLATLHEIDDDRRELGLEGTVAQPDHVLHVTIQGRYCPATEPERPRETAPLPSLNPNPNAGEGVRVSVVDTGWWKGAATHPVTKAWMSDVTSDPEDEEHLVGATIHEYAGHGTFAAGVVQCMAPGSRVEVEGALPHGGAVYESDICEQLEQALVEDNLPQLISISAGTHTRKNMGLLGLEILAARKGFDDGVKTLVVAAAGNDSSDQKFYPAAYDWVVGVGSVDPDGKRSDFSNYGEWVKVYARGRELINAFPVGTYTCHYPENIHNGVPDKRKFDGLARWSGTSFATPLVTGAIAAHMTATNNLTEPWKAYQELFQAAPTGPGGERIIGPLT